MSIMKRKSVFNLSKILVFALFPYLSVSVINGSERILLNYRPDSEVYLTAVLSCQISPDYELQTVEAQAVIARSNLFRKFAEEENRLDVLREMGKSIKNQWKWWISDEIYEDAVENTEGKVLLVDGKLDLVPYHEISGGTTRERGDCVWKFRVSISEICGQQCRQKFPGLFQQYIYFGAAAAKRIRNKRTGFCRLCAESSGR